MAIVGQKGQITIRDNRRRKSGALGSQFSDAVSSPTLKCRRISKAKGTNELMQNRSSHRKTDINRMSTAKSR